MWQVFPLPLSLTALYLFLSVARPYQHKNPLSWHDRSVKPSKYLIFITVWVCPEQLDARPCVLHDVFLLEYVNKIYKVTEDLLKLHVSMVCGLIR